MSRFDLSGWIEVGCSTDNEMREDKSLCILAGITDYRGECGPPMMYREYGDANGSPILRYYLHDPSAPDARCRHYVKERVA